MKRTALVLMMLLALLMPLPAYEVALNNVRVRVDGLEEAQWDEVATMLRNQITLNGSAPVGEPLADDLAFFTRQLLVREGWEDVAVTWKLDANVIGLAVDLGTRITVGTITIIGNTVLPDDELRKYLVKPTLERPESDDKAVPWVDADLKQGVSLVQRRYIAEGYLKATVVMTPAEELDAEKRRDITLTISQGPRFVFGDSSIDGEPPELRKRMQAELTAVAGTPFNEARVQRIEKQLSSICVEQGWLHAETKSEYRLGRRGGTVDVLFHVNPGQQVRITGLSVHPDFSRGAERVLRARFRPLQGRIYRSEESDFYFRRALDTRMFDLLDTEVLPVAGDPTRGVLRITGEERKPVTLGFEVGFDTFLGGQAGVSYENTNWRDTGNTLDAELSYSVAGPVGFVRWINPAFYGSDYAVTLRLALEQFNRFEYDRLGSSLSLDVARRVSVPFSYSFFVNASANTVDPKNLTLPETGPTDYTLATIGANLMHDRRDNPVLPKKGWYVSARLESTLNVAGSDVSFLRSELRGAWYRPITRRFRFAAGGQLTSIQGAGVEELPIDARVFNGGPTSVRSFAQRELGPVTPGGTPLGGTSAMFLSAEFSYEIVKNLEFAVFADMGSLGRDRNSSPFAYSSDFRYAVGAGLRYHLPFGPIRIDYGHNPNPRANEKSGMLHVTVGFSF